MAITNHFFLLIMLFSCTYVMSAAESIEPSALCLEAQRLFDELFASATDVVAN